MSSAVLDSTTVDVAVIGAGIMGASCAYHLAVRGSSVVVLESFEAPAMGSSGRSFASLRGQWMDETNIQLAWGGIQAYRDFESRYGVDVGYEPTGYLLLVPEGNWERQVEAVALQQSLGVPVEAMSPESGLAYSDFDVEGLGGCTWGSADGVVDPHLVTTTYLTMARKLGAKVKFRHAVTSIDKVGDLWEIRTETSLVRARHVVNAAGGWAGEIGALAGLSVPVQHFRRMIFASAPDAIPRRLPMTIDVATGFYLRSEGNRLLMGFANPDEAPGYTTRVDWSWLESALTAGVERFPWLEDVPMDAAASWAGTYEITPDHVPLVGEMPGAPGWVNACGFSGHGVMQAPMIGQLVAEEIVDGRACSVDIETLRIERLTKPTTQKTALVF